MVNVHKRNKRTRARGSRSSGTGFRKKKKGHGNKGGHGWSGTSGQKMQKAQRHAKKMGFEKYFGSRGYTSASVAKKKILVMNLDDIRANLFNKEGQKIDLSKYRILGNGEGFNAEITAKSATLSAIEKMNKSGGKITILEVKEKKIEKTTTGKNNVKVKKKK